MPARAAAVPRRQSNKQLRGERDARSLRGSKVVRVKSPLSWDDNLASEREQLSNLLRSLKEKSDRIKTFLTPGFCFGRDAAGGRALPGRLLVIS